MNLALKLAIEKSGGRVELARKLGIRPQAISQWTQAPYFRVLQIEKISGVDRSDLRPDLYPPEATVQR
ncbi:Cro/CI family transcriptional regulator [Rhizobium sp. SG741]|uniref:transcriptional regulator n=1 Tax=Rhizobium sp. SG741 TaxID=2587114 RepID=UPI001444F6BB|nr:Cro/CI family transcriptional regulator [Rhizobium sp. SG741]NKJ03454.1 DNA-binding transcriptional regulator YdaS (Cro superfamily) [Rhizobium sp. SG741]